MPSFFESMKRIIQGKPVFDGSDQTQQDPFKQRAQLPPAPAAVPPQRTGPKVIPQVIIVHTETHLNDRGMVVECEIQNNSQQIIELDKIRLLGTTRELDRPLKPGERQEFQVYSGPRMPNQGQREAQLDYKNQMGDYFRALHFIEYDLRPDKTFAVRQFKFSPPVRDI